MDKKISQYMSKIAAKPHKRGFDDPSVVAKAVAKRRENAKVKSEVKKEVSNTTEVSPKG